MTFQTRERRFFAALSGNFGETNVKHDVNFDAGRVPDFPVSLEDGSVTSALSISDVLQQHLPLSFDSVYVAPELTQHVREYLKINLSRILADYSSREE